MVSMLAAICLCLATTFKMPLSLSYVFCMPHPTASELKSPAANNGSPNPAAFDEDKFAVTGCRIEAYQREIFGSDIHKLFQTPFVLDSVGRQIAAIAVSSKDQIALAIVLYWSLITTYYIYLVFCNKLLYQRNCILLWALLT